jgi:hypothetical protein
MQEPRFRASWVKLAVAGVNCLAEADRKRVRTEIGDAMLDKLRQATIVDWVPASYQIAIGQALISIHGAAFARDFWNERLIAALKTPFVTATVEPVARLFGLSAHTVFKAVPRMYALMARDVGRVVIDKDANGATILSFEDTPAVLCNRAWYVLCEGQCHAVLAFAKVKGTVTPRLNLAPGRFQFIVRPS